MYLTNIETQNLFASLLLHIISVHSMKITEVNIFHGKIFIFGYVISLVSHRH